MLSEIDPDILDTEFDLRILKEKWIMKKSPKVNSFFPAKKKHS